MHPTISTEDIAYTEQLLFNKTGVFDGDRMDFLRNFNTIDLHAAPGSGKTTVLLAKLALLQKKLHSNSRKGILVISHTNTAVDEIKEKLGKHCPDLFAYPNFVGTIQSFVNQFLAEPFFSQVKKRKIYRIDNDAYEEALEWRLPKKLDGFNKSIYDLVKHLNKGNPKLIKQYRLNINNNGETIVCKSIAGEPIALRKPHSKKDYTQEEKVSIKNYLLALKRNILHDGILCYDDAYYLASVYLQKYPKVKSLLRERFSYVFVDEMQDMHLHQIKLLDNLFYQAQNPELTFQRIGDKNQSIFDGQFPSSEVWNTKSRPIMQLAGSKRFHPVIADLVKPFALETIDIRGNEQIRTCPPIMLLYDDASIQEVIPYYPKLIREEAATHKIDLRPTHKLKAIAWRKDAEEDNISLKSYYRHYTKNSVREQQHDFPNVWTYLHQPFPPEKGLSPIRKYLLNALLKLYRLEGIKISQKVYFTKTQFISFAQEKPYYTTFLAHLYQWTLGVYRKDFATVHTDIVRTLPTVLFELFAHTTLTSKGRAFLEDRSLETIVVPESKQLVPNVYACPETGLSVEVSTVHSVKGETHFATMYMESSYYGAVETQKIMDQLLGQPFNDERVRHKETTRMMYVGLSRPVQFLVFACHHNNVQDHLDKLGKRWKINTELLNR